VLDALLGPAAAPAAAAAEPKTSEADLDAKVESIKRELSALRKFADVRTCAATASNQTGREGKVIAM
jgi:hypothetical protein